MEAKMLAGLRRRRQHCLHKEGTKRLMGALPQHKDASVDGGRPEKQDVPRSCH
jgi:hypothetical protein